MVQCQILCVISLLRASQRLGFQNAGADPVGEALEQLFRYEGRYPDKPSIKRFFHYNQLMVATSFEDAVAGPSVCSVVVAEMNHSIPSSHHKGRAGRDRRT